MDRVCQLTDDVKYYLCMEPVDMRKQFQLADFLLFLGSFNQKVHFCGRYINYIKETVL